MNELYYFNNKIYSNKSYNEYTNIFNREVRDCFKKEIDLDSLIIQKDIINT